MKPQPYFTLWSHRHVCISSCLRLFRWCHLFWLISLLLRFTLGGDVKSPPEATNHLWSLGCTWNRHSFAAIPINSGGMGGIRSNTEIKSSRHWKQVKSPVLWTMTSSGEVEDGCCQRTAFVTYRAGSLHPRFPINLHGEGFTGSEREEEMQLCEK